MHLAHLTLGEWESISKIIGFLAAAVFFTYKALSGYFVTNMSVKLTCHRQQKTPTDDYLVVSVYLSKGAAGSVNIHDAQARVRHSGKCEAKPLLGLCRLSYTTGQTGSAEQKLIN